MVKKEIEEALTEYKNKENINELEKFEEKFMKASKLTDIFSLFCYIISFIFLGIYCFTLETSLLVSTFLLLFLYNCSLNISNSYESKLGHIDTVIRLMKISEKLGIKMEKKECKKK